MAYSQPIADVLREFFVLSNIDAGFEEQAGCGVFTFRTKLHCRMQTAQMTVLVREDNFSTLTAITPLWVVCLGSFGWPPQTGFSAVPPVARRCIL